MAPVWTTQPMTSVMNLRNLGFSTTQIRRAQRKPLRVSVAQTILLKNSSRQQSMLHAESRVSCYALGRIHADHRFPFPLVAERDLRAALQPQRLSSRGTQQPRRIQLRGTRGTPLGQLLG